MKSHDALFDYEMPQWYTRTAYLVRGICLGFAAGYLLAGYQSTDAFEVPRAVLVVIACATVGVLPSIPKAWIEQRNRYRAWKDGTLGDKAKERQNTM